MEKNEYYIPLIGVVNPVTGQSDDVFMNDVFVTPYLTPVLPGSSAVSFPAASVASSNSSGLSQQERVDSLIAVLDKEVHAHLESYATIRASCNTTESDACLANVERVRKEIETLRSLSATFKQSHSHESKFEEGLKLIRHDIPTFRLASAQFPLGGKVEVFDSDKHYLEALENIVESSSSMEVMWRKFYPLVLAVTFLGSTRN